MKKCPTCDRTFEDSLKFCQIDGTPLLGIAEINSEDSFKTMVGSFNSEGDENLSQPANESFGSSPFDNPSNSPFDASAPSFKESETMFNEPQTPFGNSPSFGSQAGTYNPPMQQTEWTPPPAPISEWQNQNIGQNTPFQTPVSGQGEDKTLAIVSLVCGILGLTCCGPVTGIAALITGFMAKNNAEANPNQFGGRGLALAGMIMGGISVVLTILWFILVVLGGAFR